MVPVLHFKYLGTFISSDGSLRRETTARSIYANSAFNKMPRGLWQSDLPLWIKWELYKHLILPILTYGTEAWAPTADDLDVLEGTFIRHLRQMTRLSWTSTHNQRVLPPRSSIDAVGGFPSMKDILRTARLRLYGQITRAGPYSFIGKWAHCTIAASNSTPRGPKAPGWSNIVSGDLLDLGLNASHCFAMANWKELISYQPRGPRKIGFADSL